MTRSLFPYLVDRCVALARVTAEQLRDNRFTILDEVDLNQVLVRCDTDELTVGTCAAALAAGATWLSPALWQGRPAFRISVSSWRTSAEDTAWGSLSRAGERSAGPAARTGR